MQTLTPQRTNPHSELASILGGQSTKQVNASLQQLFDNGELSENDELNFQTTTSQVANKPRVQGGLFHEDQRKQFQNTFEYAEDNFYSNGIYNKKNSSNFGVFQQYEEPKAPSIDGTRQPKFAQRLSDMFSKQVQIVGNSKFQKRVSSITPLPLGAPTQQQQVPVYHQPQVQQPQAFFHKPVAQYQQVQQPQPAPSAFTYLNKRNLKQIQKQVIQNPTIPHELSFAAQSVMQSGKRRGRKRERDDLYFMKAQDRIIELRTILKTAKEDGLTVKERQRLRNQVSAQQSRIKRKEESMFLHGVVKTKDMKFTQLMDILMKTLSQEQMQSINNQIYQDWSIEAPKKFQEQNFDIINPFGGAALARERSKEMTQEDDKNEDVQETLFKFDMIIENFETRQEDLDKFKQNDEKLYSDDESKE